MRGEPLQVAVVSSQPVVLHGLVSLLQRHRRRVRIVDLPGADDRDHPDVVLWDVVDLVGRDTSALERLLESTSAKVLAVGRDLRPDLAARALTAGAHRCVSIGASESELLEAVVSSAWSDAEEPGPPEAEIGLGAGVGLTTREVQVLTLIAQGRTNQEIAQGLFLSPNSIKTYVRTAYRKIGAQSRSQAVSWAIRNGFPVDET